VTNPLDAVRLVGLLAEGARLRTVAALVLGYDTLAAITRATGLETREAMVALDRLVQAGLVEEAGDGAYHLLEAAFATAAREAAPPTRTDEHDDHPSEVARVLRTYVRDGRLTQIPMQRSKRLVVLDVLAQDFEPGRRYTERQVNVILGKWHADWAALRRYLVDEGMLSRADGEYWRSGASFEVE